MWMSNKALLSLPGSTSPVFHTRAAQLYALLPLPSRQRIHVLELFPGSPTDPLRGTLRTVDLENSPCFTALSYVWKQPPPSTDPSTVFVNEDCQLETTPNYRDALLALRHISEIAALTILVDSVCINQADPVEKAVQIPLMEAIFTFAETTYLWLVPGSEEIYAKIAWMHRANFLVRPWPGIPWLQGNKVMTMLGDHVRSLRRTRRFDFSELAV
ncbi:heterokaryon incompatibility protein-domain-containing protein [Immersiella caudata]|uniref:Heterokaryon incompatibility protein-domain-containing protein n=1 Tax=Immersiella caudata TaxID=314043 RepID=A0AA40BZT9_9PEZI|nr:heterokaryon incompatibility protein-domain-containing protein [Immersiella caudata]